MNFYDLLNQQTDESNDYNICLISQENLEDNYITLKCNHTFNYLPLYHELVKQKTNINVLETIKVRVNEIKCPYCRSITPNIMPFIDISGVKLIKGVNYPKKYSLTLHKCEWIFKSGKKKGCQCCAPAIKTNSHILCKTHSNMSSNKKKDAKDHELYNFDVKDYKKYTVAYLKKILKEMNCKVNGTKCELIDRLHKQNYTFENL